MTFKVCVNYKTAENPFFDWLDGCIPAWQNFINSIPESVPRFKYFRDNHLLDDRVHDGYVYFISEEHYCWFLLRWS
jgi:hypothetical protein